jgi:hypothetical protein
MENSIIAFYSEQSRDHRGRLFSDILKYTDVQIEEYHDFIQWLFPLTEPSPFNPLAPTLDKETQAEFKSNAVLKINLCKACCRMLSFYGLCCSCTKPPSDYIKPNDAFVGKAENWMTFNNHNHLRLTRILISLRLLGLEDCSRSLYNCLMLISKNQSTCFSNETIRFWNKTQSQAV